MSVKATENCIESLIAKGVDVSDVVLLTPTVWLDTDCPQIFKETVLAKLKQQGQARRTGLRVFWNVLM